MNWDAIVAIVEIVGLIAVVASLVYLAIQVRQNSQLISQNTLVARSAMVHATSASYARFFELIADNSELAGIFHRGKKSEELDPVEIEMFEAILEVYFTSLEDMDHQFKSDLYFDEDDDEDLIQFMASAYRDMIMCTPGSNWWSQSAKARCTPSFYNKIQKIREGWAAETD